MASCEHGRDSMPNKASTSVMQVREQTIKIWPHLSSFRRRAASFPSSWACQAETFCSDPFYRFYYCCCCYCPSSCYLSSVASLLGGHDGGGSKACDDGCCRRDRQTYIHRYVPRLYVNLYAWNMILFLESFCPFLSLQLGHFGSMVQLYELRM